MHDRGQLVAAAAATLSLLLLYSKGYSPQYLTWLAPLLVLLFPNRQGAVYLAALSAINLVELPIYFSFLPGQHWLLTVLVLCRTGLLMILAAAFLTRALTPTPVRVLAARAKSQQQHGW